MNEKERAIEIYNKFRNENSIMSANYRAKKQSLICVEELIKETGTKYWYNVKKELLKL